jgi:hypothetical protein
MMSLVRKCHAEPAAAAKHLGRGVSSASPDPSSAFGGLGMTGWCPFSSAVVLVATSMKDSEERSDEEYHCYAEILRFAQIDNYQHWVD